MMELMNRHNHMRDILNKAKIDWIYEMNATPNEVQVNRIIDKLDQVAIDYEARWGVNRLEGMVSDEMREKWMRQVQKVNQAIEEKNPIDLGQLMEGTIRGWKAMEDNALSNGHRPNDPRYVEYQHPSGTLYKICYTIPDARLLAHQATEDCRIVTIEEMANLMNQRENQVYGQSVKCDPVENKITFFDWQEGDTIPFPT